MRAKTQYIMAEIIGHARPVGVKIMSPSFTTEAGHDRSSTRPAKPRKGYAAVMAMLFLVLGTSLAAGLYALVQSSTAITSNEQAAALALGAAETGVQFMSYQLSKAAVEAKFTGTDSTQWIGPLASQLGVAMNGKTNLGNQSLNTTSTSITVPSISLAGGASFTATVDANNNTGIRLTVTGNSKGGVSRTLQVNFSGTPATTGGPVQFPLITRGHILNYLNVSRNGAEKVKETAGTATPVDLIGSTTKGTALIYNGMPAPTGKVPFPNTDALITAVGDLILPKRTEAVGATISGTYSSYRIPAGKNYTLKGTINGVVYVEWPNNITLVGPMTLNGTIVYERKGTKSGTSMVKINRSSDIERPMDAANTEIVKLSFTDKDKMKWWTLIAPDADFDIPNGSTGSSTKVFEGSLHFNSITRQGGPDNFELTKGGLVAEGDINLKSNSTSYAIDPGTGDGSGGGGGTAASALTLTAASYSELPN